MPTTGTHIVFGRPVGRIQVEKRHHYGVHQRGPVPEQMVLADGTMDLTPVYLQGLVDLG